ncbi:hypothetical protein L3Q82_012140 [Scortum barcoo]|uniref:Uncharacterized protein n=1 Tax=Scortum barcoo TaxID=214431 RepID=A0ACB8W9T9_9TELE|nr:hypothetical protein L3Q82_012140 [Scortum barcoo]
MTSHRERRNWCTFVHKRTVTKAVACGIEKYTIKSQNLCPSGSPDCQVVMYKLANRTVYKQQPQVVTSLLWRCCPGHGGPNCEDTALRWLNCPACPAQVLQLEKEPMMERSQRGRETGLPAAAPVPGWLRITHGGEDEEFTDPGKEMDYVKKKIIQLQGSSANPRGRDQPRPPLNFGGGEGGAEPRMGMTVQTCLPSVITGNVRSLPNKMKRASGADEAAAGVPGVQPDALHREPRLNHLTPDSLYFISQSGQEYKGEREEEGRGNWALFVNDRWCNPGHIHVKEQRCTGDMELLAVSIRPYYLPREFPHVITAITTYIPPSADDAACELLHSVVAQLQTEHPQAFLLITGDFNHAYASLSTATLPNFHQYVNCCTRDNKTLDLLSANTAGAYSSSPLPPLGRSDHNLVHLRPVYTPVVKRQPPNKRRVKQKPPCPTKRVRCFSNNKPWVTPDLRALLQEKRRAFQSGDRDELRRVQRDLKRKIKECKASYRRKMEDHLQQNNAREVWRGLQAISGQGKNERRNPEPGDRDWANKLNLFFNRFDTGPTSTPLSLSTDQPTSSSLCLHAPSPPSTPPPSLGLSPSPPPPPAFTTISTSSCPVEDFLCGSSPQNFEPQGAQPLQTRGLNVSPDEGTGEDRPQAPPPPGLCVRCGGLQHRCPPGNSPLTFPLHPVHIGLHAYSTDSCHLQKFSDDTAIVGCVSEGNDCEYRKVIMDFVDWCELNHLQVNASKTKEMVIDFSRKPSSNDIAPVNIQGLDIERVRTYKYLGVHLNNKLDWTDNTDSLYKRGQSRLYMLRRLGSFGVCRPLLRAFYETVVASVVSYAVVCWGGGCSERDKKRLNRLIKRASSVCGCPLDSIEVMGREEGSGQTVHHHGQHLPPSASDFSDTQLDSALIGGSETVKAGLQAPDVTLQRGDPNREQNDDQVSVSATYNIGYPDHGHNATHPALHAGHTHHSHHASHQTGHTHNFHQASQHAANTHHDHRQQELPEAPTAPPYPDVPAVLPVPHMMVLVMSQLQPVLEGFNRSLEQLSRQVGELVRDVAQLKSSQLGVQAQGRTPEGPEMDQAAEERLDTKLDEVFEHVREVQRQMESHRTDMEIRLHSQHAMLHYNLTSFKTDIDIKLKRHQKMLQVNLQAMNATLAELRVDQDQDQDQDTEDELEDHLPPPAHPTQPSDTSALWEAIERLDDMVVNNTVKVRTVAILFPQLRRELKELGKQINQTARTSQIQFMETGLEVEAAREAVLRWVGELAGNLSQQGERLQEMDVDVDYLYTALYKHNSTGDCDCKGLKAAVARLEVGMANVTELANENRLALEESDEGGAGQWGGASDWEPAVEALQHGLQLVKESLALEHSRTRTLDLSLAQLNSSVTSGLAEVSSLKEADRTLLENMGQLSNFFNSLLKDVIRHSDVLELLLGEEVLEFLEWPVQDQEAHSILALKEQLRNLQEQLKRHNLSINSLLGNRPGAREEVPSADQPATSSHLHYEDRHPGSMRRSSDGVPARERQLLLHPGGRRLEHRGDGGDLWNLEKTVEELGLKVLRLEEKCYNTSTNREAPPGGVEAKLQAEVIWLKRGLEEHLRVFKNVFSNADVLVGSDATLELDKLWQLVKSNDRKKQKKRGGGNHRSRRDSSGVVPALFSQSEGSLLVVAASPLTVSNNVITLEAFLNRGQFYSDTGSFTAPVDGIYLFVLTLDLRPGPAHVVLRRGSGRASLHQQEVTEEGPVTGVSLLLLREGEEVRLELKGGTWEESEDNVFTVLLLHRTT